MDAVSLPRAARILLVEDNPADVELTRATMAETKLANDLYVVPDGDEALAFLRRQGGHGDAPHVDMVILDLKLPGKSGREVLAEIKSDPDLQTVPVVVLTTSSTDDDVTGAYRARANCYIRKPIDLEQFMHVVRQIERFWLTIVCLPPG
jgi:two-component system, chemotaxis family, response regulator Rcp1